MLVGGIGGGGFPWQPLAIPGKGGGGVTHFGSSVLTSVDSDSSVVTGASVLSVVLSPTLGMGT